VRRRPAVLLCCAEGAKTTVDCTDDCTDSVEELELPALETIQVHMEWSRDTNSTNSVEWTLGTLG
jgi:hypothetical protein